MPTANTARSASELTATLLLRLTREPATWTARGLATELGETPVRVHNALRDIARAGWRLERATPNGPMTLSSDAENA
ncbi:hypothetical protein [Deinococcus maricopensis]|uniref:Uncharacterized protein n=1 Tax=Deinococcus maricopensis (strain DSM 21211 / LMG 22137 / NRRL B-23946 / LB-34) TaxID=709986 RepID=E8U6Q9_DEIML|nr:hypothetical protein [Deinococcus maricopensis]ADV66748.1 hypothetical protein Deima_1095 [Deinococcus maricopensis DSM 21211]